MGSADANQMLNAYFPANYIRRADVLKELPEHCAKFGNKVMVFGGHTALDVVKQHAGVMENASYHWFGGICSQTNIDKMVAQARAESAEVLVAVGGGKALDTGKAVANETGLPLITVPTITATCAAVTPMSIRYFDDGHFSDIYMLDKAPDLILTDTQLLSEAPLRWLSAGLGDTLAKWYEYRSLKHDPSVLHGPTALTSANCHLCYKLIAEYGEQACKALAAKESNYALEQVTDAIILFAGFTAILSSGSHASGAHGLFEGFTVNDDVREFGHGLLVGYGNLVLLALEERSDEELREAITLAKACGVPTQLKAIKADWDAAEWDAVLRASVDTPDMVQLPFTVTTEMLDAAVKRVDQLAAS